MRILLVDQRVVAAIDEAMLRAGIPCVVAEGNAVARHLCGKDFDIPHQIVGCPDLLPCADDLKVERLGVQKMNSVNQRAVNALYQYRSARVQRGGAVAVDVPHGIYNRAAPDDAAVVCKYLYPRVQNRACRDVNGGVRLGERQNSSLYLLPTVNHNRLFVRARKLGLGRVRKNGKVGVIPAVQTNHKIVGTIQINRDNPILETVTEALPRRHDRVVMKITSDPNVHAHTLSRKREGGEPTEFIGAPAVDRVAVDAAVFGMVVNRKCFGARSLRYADMIEVVPFNALIEFGINNQLVFHWFLLFRIFTANQRIHTSCVRMLSLSCGKWML